MITMGIDIGSTTSKCVILENGIRIVASALQIGGIGTESPAEVVRKAMAQLGVNRSDIQAVAATGYGRNRWEDADFQVSELSCHGLGVNLLLPSVRTIIDIGGQDAKVISLTQDGKMRNFLMNDKCAAGTGRFLDVMATILQIPVNDMARYVQAAQKPVSISSTCTVFAESEVISQLANGVDRADLIAGICESVAARVAALAKRCTIEKDVCMSGGVAQNAGVRLALERDIGCPILFSEWAQLFGAIGAARYAWQKAE